MNKNLWWLVAVMGLITLVPIGYFLYNYHEASKVASSPYATFEYVSQKPKEMVPGSEFMVASCQIVDGHIFLMRLDNKEVIEARLTTVTKEEATPVVVEALKSAISPSVVLRRKIGSYWVVDFNLTTETKRVNLVEWLEGKKLTL